MEAQPRAIARMAIVAVVAALTFANTLSNGFALDDEPLIAANTRVHALDEPAGILLTPLWPEFGARAGLYRPLSVVAWALQWAAGGGQPWLFHMVSVLLYATVALLVFALLRRMVTPNAALFGALIFAVHPVHTEVAANVVGQAELLAAAAVLAACVLHMRRDERTDSPGTGRILLMTALFAAGLLAKESAIVLPGLLVALDAANGRFRVRSRLPLMAGLGVVAVAYFALRVHVLGSITGTDAAPTLPLLRDAGARLLVALAAWPHYLRLLFFPIDLSADYAPGVFVPPAGINPAVVLGSALLLATVVAALLTARRPAGVAAAWFLIAILPVSNLLLPIGVLLAERLLFLPSVAVALAGAHAAVLAARTLDARRLRIAAAVATVVLAAAGVRSFVRNPDWKDTSAYWNALVRDHPESYKAQRAVAQVMERRGDGAGARRYTELAYTTWPHDPELLTEVALVRMRDSEFDAVVPLLERARSIDASSRRTHIVLVRAYLANARWPDALAELARLDTASTGRAEVLALRAQAQEGLGRSPDALASWTEVIRLPDGQSWTWWTMLARASARTGDGAGARLALERARSLAPPAHAELIDRLGRAIEAGCFVADTSSATICRDPIRDWVIVTPAGALESKAVRHVPGAADREPVAGRREGST
jgi:tetratricopeptide (TPR) repeat protein